MATTKMRPLTKARKSVKHYSKPKPARPTPLAFVADFVRDSRCVYHFHAAWVIARGLVYFDMYTRTDAAHSSLADLAEAKAIWGMIRTRSASVLEIRQKMDVYRRLIEDGLSGEWTDQRDTLLLASIAQDLDAGDAGLKKEHAMQHPAQGGAK